MVSPLGGAASTVESRRPTAVAATATTKPAHGPAAPMSNSARRSGKRERMRMNAPKVPTGGSPGMKYGSDAATPYRRHMR